MYAIWMHKMGRDTERQSGKSGGVEDTAKKQ